MNEVGRTRDAGWEIGVSKTIERPVGEVWDFITSPEGVAIWLGEGVTALSERGAGYETAAGVRGRHAASTNLTASASPGGPPTGRMTRPCS
jgi:uncharacterized protein YndB with AHSA1/START domain